MSAHAGRWGLAVIGSAVANAGLALLVLLAVAPGEEPTDERHDAQVRIETHAVDQHEAHAADPGGDAVGEAEADGDSVLQAGVPASRSDALPPISAKLPTAEEPRARLAPTVAPRGSVAARPVVGQPSEDTDPVGDDLRAALLPHITTGALSLDEARAGEKEVSSESLPGRVPPAARVGAVAGGSERIFGSRAAGSMIELSNVAAKPAGPGDARIAAAPVATAPEAIPAAAPAADLLASPGVIEAWRLADVGLAPSRRLRPSDVPGPAVVGISGHGDEAPLAPDTAVRPPPVSAPLRAGISPTLPREEFVRATLAWIGDTQAQVDAASLTAIQSFMREGDVSGDAGAEVRDTLSALLASVPCARLQTVFVPEAGRLELHGHIPDEALRHPVLAALRDQMGGAIPVSDRTLILPRPQCGTLAAIAATPLPQSSDQSTNPRVVGSDAYARLYDFSDGERLIFELTGPDYPAHVYADYYDTEGMVIHLEPNEVMPLRRLDAAEVVRIGAEDQELELRVAPPFGQEIVVAMAASSPLYEGVRPLREPALPYLQLLGQRVEAARERDPGFKGEWVYFFVRTRAGG